MTKEQEEAIEYFNKNINYFKEQIKFIEAVDSDYYDEEYELYKNRVKQFETILSMLKEKDKEIEFQKDIRNTEKNRHKKTEKSLKGIINKQNTELAEKNAEIERLNRQIDLMAETIRKLAISLASYEGSYNKETINFTGNIKDIKQYFEQKVTNNG